MKKEMICINCGTETTCLICGLVCDDCWKNPGDLV